MKIRNRLWKDGKKGCLTFSYDDGRKQDYRLVEIFNKYGMKGTFNLNSGFMRDNGDHVMIKDVATLYEGHEVAVHTLTHPYLQEIEEDSEIIRQIEKDRKNLEEIMGYEICGMAYPGNGDNAGRVAKIIKEHTKIKYARTTVSTFDFELQDNLYIFNPTLHHDDFDNLFRLGEEFLAQKPETPKLFYIWGHSFEFDIFDTWGKFEDFLKLISGKEDIFYGTNREVLL